MIVLEGTPGAGKTTRLGALLAAHPDSLIFPEAQPPPGATHPEELNALLAEDHQRTRHAAAAAADTPHVIVASDRCHLGVLAYRYALATTHLSTNGVFEHALEQARRLNLDARHHDDEVRVTIIDPELSRRRRARFAGDRRYQTWFDVEFLTAYNRFLLDLDRWITPGARWSTNTSTDRSPPPTPHQAERLRCTRDCHESRSPIVRVSDRQAQLYTAAVHHRAHAHTPVACLRTADKIAAAWRGSHRHLNSSPQTTPAALWHRGAQR